MPRLISILLLVMLANSAHAIKQICYSGDNLELAVQVALTELNQSNISECKLSEITIDDYPDPIRSFYHVRCPDKSYFLKRIIESEALRDNELIEFYSLNKTLSTLDYINIPILTFSHYKCDKESYYTLSEYIEGITLGASLKTQWQNKGVKDYFANIYSKLGKKLAELHMLGIESYSDHVGELNTTTIHGDLNADNVIISTKHNVVFVDLGDLGKRSKALPVMNDVFLITSHIRHKIVFENDFDSNVFPIAMNNLRITYSNFVKSYCGVFFNFNPLPCEEELNRYFILSTISYHNYKINNSNSGDNEKPVSGRELHIRLRMLNLHT